MKKVMILSLGALIMLSSCGTASGTGAYVGGQFGHVIGSAIGGISGGWRGHDVGSLVGTVGGAVAGAAIGAAIDNAQQRKYEQAAQQRQTKRVKANPTTTENYDDGYDNGSYGNGTYDESGFDPQGGGDDRISFDGDQSGASDQSFAIGSTAPKQHAPYSLAKPKTVAPTAENIATMDALTSTDTPLLVIRHARVSDANHDMVLSRNEECKIQFEIMNDADHPVFNIQPTVVELTGNKHVHISPNLNVESIAAHGGVRYTATILADGKLKDGEVKIRIGVLTGNRELASQIEELTIPTRKLR